MRFVFLQLGIVMAIPLLVYFWIDYIELALSFRSLATLKITIPVVSIIAILISVAIGVVAQKLRNIKLLFVALAYASLSAMVLLHGISLGIFGAYTQISYVYAQLGLLLAAFWLWLSSLSADHRLVRWLTTKYRILLPIWCFIMIVLGYSIWISSEIAWFSIIYGDMGKRIFTMLIVLLNIWTVYRHLLTYMASKVSIMLGIVYSTAWMNTAQIVLIATSSNDSGWWGYHFLLFISVVTVMITIVNEYKHADSIYHSVKYLYRADPNSWIQTYLTPSVKELVMKTETKDAYTAGHNYRVTVYALKLGEELGLSSTQLKSIAQGGLVHDVGKIHIPDYVLNKKGKLTVHERKLIERHPVDGYNMCKQLGFMMEELAIIRSHHEKWDGTGYPDQLSGEHIPLVARVTAVADVYDALTSSRSYRKAMSNEHAMNMIVELSGTHFDPRCIEAWKSIVEEEREFFNTMLLSHIDMKAVLS